MAEPLKNFFSPALVREISRRLAEAEPTFDEKTFIRRATRGLEDLELLERARLIMHSLRASLPEPYEDALQILLDSLGPEHQTDELIGAGMAPFFYLPHVLFVAEYGVPHFDASMRAQYELTRRFSAEFSIRAFLNGDPERTLEWLSRWATDPHPHVRRLVSEGTRLRLPWAPRVQWLDDHPDRIIALISPLRDDPATLVRRSVANNLNDLGKVWPDLLVDTCRSWLDDRGTDRRELVEHALRSAVKRGDAGALSLLGYGGKPSVSAEEIRFVPPTVAIGEKVTIGLTLRSRSRKVQNLLVDLAVHFVKADGKPRPKVFKLKRVEVPVSGEVRLEKVISLAVHTTRKPHPGEHRVDVILNGRSSPIGSFQVR